MSGRGYRFVPRVTRHEEGSVAATSAPAADPTEPPSETAPSPPGVIAEAPAPKRRFMAASIRAGAVVLLAILAAGLGWMLHEQAPPRPAAYSPQDRRQSVIVLPFENSSGDAAQDSVAAGVSRDVTDKIAGTAQYGSARPRRGIPGKTARPAWNWARPRRAFRARRAVRAARTGA